MRRIVGDVQRLSAVGQKWALGVDVVREDLRADNQHHVVAFELTDETSFLLAFRNP